jgi:threonylcarbamoyladenosine tRNA methylthiotransferase MtaB
MPNVFIGADVIAGFPGESDAEFNETVRLLEELPFSDLHVFPYSSRPGTRAAGMPGHLPAYVVTERAARLRKIAEVKKRTFQDNSVGSEQRILVQKFDKKTGLCRGLSRNYMVVAFAGKEEFVNLEVNVKIQYSDGVTCSGEAVTA